MSQYAISEIRSSEWIEVADLVAKAIPNALISKLGSRFGAAFYSKVVEQDCSCGYVARDESDSILGVIIGTTDYSKARSTAFKGQLAKLIIAVNFRLFGWSTISWVLKEVFAKVRAKKRDHTNRPAAEMVVIAVCSKARGTGLAQKLVEEMGKFMTSKGLSGPYKILTEKANARANKFYEKIGAAFVGTNLHHGRKINEWYKEIAAAKQDE